MLSAYIAIRSWGNSCKFGYGGTPAIAAADSAFPDLDALFGPCLSVTVYTRAEYDALIRF